MKKTQKIFALVALLLIIVGTLQAQLRIDWQQTYGGQVPNRDDEAWGIAPTDGGYLVAGVGRSPNSVMVTCDFGQQNTGNWLLKSDTKVNYYGRLAIQQSILLI